MREDRNGDTPMVHDDAKAAALAHVTNTHREAETAIANRLEMLRTARTFGATWDDLGAAMGMSRQTAHKRFGSSVD